MPTLLKRKPQNRTSLATKQSRVADRGSVTIFLVVFTLAALALASLIVDGGTVLNTEERAADIAQQAARAGANQLNIQALRAGTVAVDPVTGCAAANVIVQQYATANNVDVTGHTCTGTGALVTVTVTVTSRPVILQAFGSFSKTATETANVVCGSATQRGNC
jgi:Flp pilus assembly protein TadG